MLGAAGVLVGEACYTNYVQTNVTRIPCPSGTFGLNCSERFPSCYFDLFCLQQCECDGHECDLINGTCFTMDTGRSWIWCLKPFWLTTAGAASVFLNLLLFFSCICYCRKSHVLNRRRRHALEQLMSIGVEMNTFDGNALYTIFGDKNDRKSKTFTNMALSQRDDHQETSSDVYHIPFERPSYQPIDRATTGAKSGVGYTPLQPAQKDLHVDDEGYLEPVAKH